MSVMDSMSAERLQLVLGSTACDQRACPPKVEVYGDCIRIWHGANVIIVSAMEMAAGEPWLARIEDLIREHHAVSDQRTLELLALQGDRAP